MPLSLRDNDTRRERLLACTRTHGDLQITHVFVAGDKITGVIDRSEASQGDAMFDLASLTLGHEERLADLVAGYGADVDLEVIRAWWSLRSLGRPAGWSSTASTQTRQAASSTC
ncbi:phosphotransferase [Kribbella sp. NBC_01484]|uniref:phosphotransferase n=1 Tax=Kribbella sp. NBC_01484 TaxID=2903579 RepID=UPI002E34855D|nr:phosphotransferase [Kribbella sp. NBC_01484]